MDLFKLLHMVADIRSRFDVENTIVINTSLESGDCLVMSGTMGGCFTEVTIDISDDRKDEVV